MTRSTRQLMFVFLALWLVTGYQPGATVVAATMGECQSDGDCPQPDPNGECGTQGCVCNYDGYCAYDYCNSDDDCPTGEVCNNGFGVPSPWDCTGCECNPSYSSCYEVESEAQNICDSYCGMQGYSTGYVDYVWCLDGAYCNGGCPEFDVSCTCLY